MTLLFYPYTSGGFRFLFPVFPFLVYYFFRVEIFPFQNKNYPNLRPDSGNLYRVADISSPWNCRQEHEFIIGDIRTTNATESGIIFLKWVYRQQFHCCFPKSKSHGWSGGRRTTYRLNHLTAEENDQLFEKTWRQLSFFHWIQENMVCNDPALNTYYSVNYNAYALVWKNDAFEVYRRNWHFLSHRGREIDCFIEEGEETDLSILATCKLRLNDILFHWKENYIADCWRSFIREIIFFPLFIALAITYPLYNNSTLPSWKL